jgi:hypothetical protein
VAYRSYDGWQYRGQRMWPTPAATSWRDEATSQLASPS